MHGWKREGDRWTKRGAILTQNDECWIVTLNGESLRWPAWEATETFEAANVRLLQLRANAKRPKPKRLVVSPDGDVELPQYECEHKAIWEMEDLGPEEEIVVCPPCGMVRRWPHKTKRSKGKPHFIPLGASYEEDPSKYGKGWAALINGRIKAGLPLVIVWPGSCVEHLG